MKAIKDALKQMHPRLRDGDSNRTQYDDPNQLAPGKYVGVIERHRVYMNNKNETGTALVVSIRGYFKRQQFYPQYVGTYETYWNHAKTYAWNKLCDLYQDLQLTTTDENGVEHPLETADQIVDVDPVGCVVEVYCAESKNRKGNYISGLAAATEDYPIEDIGPAGMEDSPTQSSQPDESATPPEEETGPSHADPDDY